MWGEPLPPPKSVQIQRFFKRNLYRKLWLFFFRYWRQIMEGLDLNSLEFTPASTSPASSLVVWVKMDAKVWELWF